MDDQLLIFESIAENRHWKAIDIEGRMVCLGVQIIREAVMEPMKSMWGEDAAAVAAYDAFRDVNRAVKGVS